MNQATDANGTNNRAIREATGLTDAQLQAYAQQLIAAAPVPPQEALARLGRLLPAQPIHLAKAA